MRVTLLGTGGSAGVPLIGGDDGGGNWGACDPREPRNRRTRSSIIIENVDKQRLLIDTSPDMRTQFLDCRIPGADAVLFTHAHADHVTGIDDVPREIDGVGIDADRSRRVVDRQRDGAIARQWRIRHRDVQSCRFTKGAGRDRA